MARNAGSFIENQFVQGLITEATGLNFPEKAVIEAWNTRFKRTGEVVRRYGFNTETGVSGTAGAFTAGAHTAYLWDNPGKEDTTFLVIQTGRFLSFYEGDASGNFTAGKKAFDIDLLDYAAPTATAPDVRNHSAAFAGAEGNLFVVQEFVEPFYVSYDPDLDTITVTQYELQVRDMDGVDDGLEVDENPETLSEAHNYNLWNQGWDTGPVSAGFNNSHPTAIDFYLRAQGDYPNNCQIWWAYKGANSEGKESLQYDQTRMVLFGNSAAPKGHYIYNAFDIDRDSKSGFTGLERTYTVKRPTCVALFAGRVWYAGIDDQIYYSQVIEDESTYGKCYQKNDPTSETLSDLLDTDGGVIKVLGLGKATGLFSTGNRLMIFSSHGVWTVTGSGAEGTGFVATDFAVARVSTTGLISNINLLDVEGTPIWWNLEGIWTISEKGVTSLSNDTIRTFIDENVPVVNRPYVQGAYNASDRTIQWLFKSQEATSAQAGYQYDRILEFNIDTGAFYPFKWRLVDQALNCIFCVTGITSEGTSTEDVEDSNGDAVTDSLTDTVTVLSKTGVSFRNAAFKYFYADTIADTFTFFEENDADYVDWDDVLVTPTDFSSYFISGAKVHGEGKDGTIEYITVFCKTEDDASVKLQTKWDWANLGTTGKWSTPQECYSVNRTARDVSRKRLLVRGQGPAIQLHFSSVAGKPFNVIGWSSFETFDAVP